MGRASAPMRAMLNGLSGLWYTVRHVRDSDRPLTEVALLLGFAAPSAFSRWHQAQFACSARALRAARGAGGPAAAQDGA